MLNDTAFKARSKTRSVALAAGSAAGVRGLPLGWAIVCLVLAAMGLRPTIVSVGPTLPHLVEAFHLTHFQAALLTAIPTLSMGVLALPTPWLAARFGRDRAIIAALLILAAASVLRAISTTPWALLLATTGMGAGIAFAGALLPSYIKAGFPSRVAFLMGVYAMALSLGSTVAAATTGILEELPGSWRSALGVWAMPALLGACAWGVVARRERGAPSEPAVTGSKRWGGVAGASCHGLASRGIFCR